MSDIIIKNVKDFHPDHIFDCGQCFRWRREADGSWTGIAGKRIANIGYVPGLKEVHINELDKKGSQDLKESEKFWRNYLDLNRDYGKIKRSLSKKDPLMKEAIASGEGIRILNQDLWETIISFIISQNNNIPRIKGCIERLSEVAGENIPLTGGKRAGKELEDLGLNPRTLPGPKKLASMREEDLKEVRLGYRAKYLIKAGEEILERGLPNNYEEVLALTGVGPKVANCIGLFGLHNEASFPIDVWVKRVMKELYGFDEGDVKGMAEFAEKNFGKLSGIAQQYLFYYIREK